MLRGEQPYRPRLACSALAFAAALLIASMAHATEWIVDAAASRAEFNVRFIGVVRISGRFEKFRGTIEPEGEMLRIRAVIEAASLTMSTSAQERWARSEEFFDSARYPQIEYLSEPFSAERLQQGGAVGGELTLRGTTRATPIKIQPLACELEAAKPCVVKAGASVARSAFGMKTRRGMISDRVNLSFHIVARPAG
jgi:polyisoprenoid-binding protein YceI